MELKKTKRPVPSHLQACACGDNILQTQPHGTMVAAKNQLQELAIAKWPLAPVKFHWRADFETAPKPTLSAEEAAKQIVQQFGQSLLAD